MGDGYYDSKIFEKVFYAVVPKNAKIEAKKNANYITPDVSGEGAVLDACLKIKDIFFKFKNV
jgi:3-deoxy-D-manno-octulosonate 8-phosphate phosphatase KdsC-like HAD superfamily phosphatase